MDIGARRSDGLAGRMHSLDQFRGCCVASMFVVNFFGPMHVTPDLLAHRNSFFSLADTVMPAFLFAVGVSFRLTWTRVATNNNDLTSRRVRRYVQRSLILVLLSLIVYGTYIDFSQWSQMTPATVWRACVELVKANLWEVLAVIGVTQLAVLPIIGCSTAARVLGMAVLSIVHIVISHAFYFSFVLGLPNPVDRWLGSEGVRAWDGGCFGFIGWSVCLLAGTVAWDLLVGAPSVASKVRRLLALALPLMFLGMASGSISGMYGTSDAGPEQFSGRPVAASPVVPPWQNRAQWLQNLSWSGMPFVQPPDDHPWNYWIMFKRIVSAPFCWFASGFAALTLAAFVIVSDGWQWQSGLLRRFGQNALLAYVFHHLVLVVIHPLIPDDSAWWYVLAGFVLFFLITDAFVRFLERNQIHVRL